MIHRQKKNVCFIVLLILLSFLILGTRLIFLSADAAVGALDIEERPVGYNARNLILFGDRDSGGGRYQPLAFFPLSHLLSYLSFSLLGVGLFQLRLPLALIGILSCYLLYIIFKREYGGLLALLGTGLYSFNFFILFINRSALPENLFFLFTFLLILFLQKAEESPRCFFWVGFFTVLNLIAKLNGAIILIVTMCYLAYLLLIKRINYQAINKFLFGLVAGVLLGVILFFGLGLKEYTPNYLWQINYMIISGEGVETLEDSRGLDLSIIATQGGRYFITFLRRFASNLEEMLKFYRKTISGPFQPTPPPLYLILFLITLPTIFQNFKKLNRVTVFILFLFILGHLQIASFFLFWKRMIIVVPTIIFIILQALYFLKERARGARGYRLLFTLLLIFSLFIIGSELRKFSVEMLSERRTYCQYQNSKELGQIILPATIVGDEILFRFLGYENRHKFVFCHGGGPINHEKNIEKIISRRDIRYFGLFWDDELSEDIKDNIFQYAKDLNRIKRAYSHMELVKIFDFRGGGHIAIWDKYPER